MHAYRVAPCNHMNDKGFPLSGCYMHAHILNHHTLHQIAVWPLLAEYICTRANYIYVECYICPNPPMYIILYNYNINMVVHTPHNTCQAFIGYASPKPDLCPAPWPSCINFIKWRAGLGSGLQDYQGLIQ